MKPVKLTKAAKADLAQAAEYYERKAEGLGGKFLDRVEQASDRIEGNPQGYAVVFEGLRRCTIPRFPYAMFFQIRSDSSLVIACLHCKRSPALAKERARGFTKTPKDPSLG